MIAERLSAITDSLLFVIIKLNIGKNILFVC